MVLMSFPSLNFFPNGMSEIIISTLSEGSGNSKIQKPENLVIVSSNMHNLERKLGLWNFLCTLNKTALLILFLGNYKI